MNDNTNFRSLLCVAIIVGFFLPWFHGYKDFSGWEMVTTGSLYSKGASFIARYGWLLIPVLALVVLFNSLNKQSSGGLLKAGPFLVTAIFSALIIYGMKLAGLQMDQHGLFQVLGIGFYITAIASLLLIFV